MDTLWVWEPVEEKYKEFKELTGRDLIDLISKVRTLSKDMSNTSMTASEAAKKIYPNPDIVYKAAAWENYVKKVSQLQTTYSSTIAGEVETGVVKCLVKNFISDGNRYKNDKKLLAFHSHLCENNWCDSKDLTISEFLTKAQNVQHLLSTAIAKATNMGMITVEMRMEINM
jgi:hypothetical protein